VELWGSLPANCGAVLVQSNRTKRRYGLELAFVREKEKRAVFQVCCPALSKPTCTTLSKDSGKRPETCDPWSV
jgi:hypothetical protein